MPVRERRERSSLLPVGFIVLLTLAGPGLAQQAPVSSMPVSELVERGRTYLQNHDPERAQRLPGGGCGSGPEISSRLEFARPPHAQLGLAEKAITGYGTALELHPGLPDTLYNFGILLLKRQQFDGAARCFQTLLQQKPQDQDVLLLLAQCQLQRGLH